MLANGNPDQSAVDFGTSGLRGLAAGFTPTEVHAFTGAFLGLQDAGTQKKPVFVGYDLRKSSPGIAASVFAAVKFSGRQAVNAGNVPTPALAAYAMARNCPAIMVTGSHNPAEFNGIKFYRRDGELTKADEAPIRKKAARLLGEEASAGIDNQDYLPPVDGDVARAYVARFADAYPADTLKGLRIGVDLHSAVGRDLLVEIFEGLGATCIAFNRAENFVAVDTEALSAADIARAGAQIKQHQLHGVVSTDGDGDRPLLIDENGIQINGDVLGALTAKVLNIDTIVTPLTSTSAIEQTGWFGKIVRTRIGSPYVVKAMAEVEGQGRMVAGFEANGGFLLGTGIDMPEGKLSALPTRDALLPLIAVLAMANSLSLPLSALTDKLPARFMKADRIKQITNEKAQTFLEEMASSRAVRARVDQCLANPVAISEMDGVRMSFADASIVHFRQSGNAPEMRIYVETDARDLTEHLLAKIKQGLGNFLEAGELSGE